MRLFPFFLMVLLLATGSVQDPKSRVIGVALDENDAVVVGVIVQVKSGNVRYRAKTNGDGRFEIELPPGCYELTAEHESFRRFRISSFQVRPNTAELVNIHLQVAPPRLPLKVQGLLTLSPSIRKEGPTPSDSAPQQIRCYIDSEASNRRLVGEY